MKKLISFVCMSLLLVQIAAEARIAEYRDTKPSGWEVIYSGEADSSNCVSDLEQETVRSGEYSLKMGCSLATVKAGNISLKYKLPEEKKSGNYELSFYAYGDYSDTSVYAGVTEILGASSVLRRFTAADDSEHAGWKKYTTNIAYSGEEYLKFQFSKGCASIYIDDISMIEGQTDLIANGGFEIIEESITTEIETDEPADNPSQSGLTFINGGRNPANVMAYNDGNYYTLSWKNPAEGIIKKLALYEIKGGREYLCAEDFETSPNACVKYVGKADGAEHTFKLLFVFDDGHKSEYFFDNLITPKRSIADWELEYNPGISEEGTSLPMAAWIDRTEKHGAEAAFKISSNAAKIKDGNIVLSQETNLKSDTNYILYLWRRAENASPYTITYGGNEFKINPQQKENSDWECLVYQLSFSEKEDSKLRIIFEKETDGVWLDDIELYRVENGNPVGENLIKNGDFEKGIKTELPGEVAAFTSENTETGGTLSWVEGQNFETISLYSKSGEGYARVALFGGGNSCISFNNLKAKTEYEYAIVSQSENLNDSKAEYAKIIPIGAEADFGEIIVEKNSDGRYEIQRSVENLRVEQGYSAELIAALFENGGMTKIVSGGRQSISCGEKKDLSVLIDVSGANLKNSHIEIFTWDELFGLKIMAPHEIYFFK